MPTLQCPNCGKVVRFEGVAGVCPSCASVVRAAKPASTKPVSGAKAASGTSRSRSGQGADLNQLAGGDEEVFNPSASPGVYSNPLAGLDPRLLYGGGGVLFLILLFGLYMAFRTPSADIKVPTQSLSIQTTNQPAPGDTPAPTAAPVAETPPPSLIPAFVGSTQPATSQPAWMVLHPLKPKLPEKPITDKMVEASIKRAVAYLKSKFENSALEKPDGSELYAGRDAICVYSLLHAGQAVDDSTLGISDPFMQGLLDRLKKFDMTKDLSTYQRSLRASALAFSDRDVDHTQLEKDRQWLQSAASKGSYGYFSPPPGTPPENVGWDNSNCQYGVLGIWATVQTGLDSPAKYWNEVEQHWLGCECEDGGWNYKQTEPSSTISMTCAGVTTLCVTAEQLELIAGKGKKDPRPQMTKAINRGLEWMGTGNHLTNFNDGHAGYDLYGVERAALATGFRYFGNHDWYRELGAREISEQSTDGSFRGGDGDFAETAFRILFLSRGRQPLLYDKLKFDGDWNDRPRDVAKLTQFASVQLEKPFAWGVADLSRSWTDWLESPVLFITTDAAPTFSDEDCQKLRSYTDAGGMIFFHNEFASKDVDAFVKDLAKRLYPEYAMNKVTPENLIYTSDFPIDRKFLPELQSVSNGTRTLFVYSPKDISPAWVRYRPKDSHKDPNLQLGINLFVTAAGKSDFRNRLNSPYEDVPVFDPVGTVPLLQLKYPGAWNPEPKAYERFPRWFQNETSIKLDVQPVSLLELQTKQAPVVVLTGNDKNIDFSKMDFHALSDYVNDGGVLFIDSTGGGSEFSAAVRKTLLPTAFPGIRPSDIPARDPILVGDGPCMDALPKPRLRNYATMLINNSPNTLQKNVQYAQVGKGLVIICDLDVTTGLLNSGTYGIVGYTPAYSQSLLKNVILWALSRYHKA